MTPRASYGVTNPNSFFDANAVREIRLLHLCDGIAASQIARDLGVNVSCISRIVNWKSWAGQDQDLRAIPKPGTRVATSTTAPRATRWCRCGGSRVAAAFISTTTPASVTSGSPSA